MAPFKGPPLRVPSVQPLSHETYLQAMTRQRHLTDHWRRVDYAKGLVDDGPPHAVINVRLKLKRLQTEGERLGRIENHNKHMLQNILRSMTAPTTVDHYHKIPPKRASCSLNYNNRMLFLKAVRRDNKALLGRIINTRPVYNHVDMEADYQNKIRSVHNQRAVFNTWNRRMRQRRKLIMSGKPIIQTFDKSVIDLKALGKRTAETHRGCFLAWRTAEPFRQHRIPPSCRSPAGAKRVDHTRCFNSLAVLPPIPNRRSPSSRRKQVQFPTTMTRSQQLREEATKSRTQSVSPPRSSLPSPSNSTRGRVKQKKAGEVPAKVTRSQQLRDEAIKSRAQFVTPPASSARGRNKSKEDKIKTTSNQTQKDKNQSARTAVWSERYQKMARESPYHTSLILDKLRLPPITPATPSLHTREEAGGRTVNEPDRNRLSPTPVSKRSHKGGGHRRCALGPADTSVTGPGWSPDIALGPARGSRQTGGHLEEETADPDTTVPDTNASNVSARSAKRTTVASLPRGRKTKAGRGAGDGQPGFGQTAAARVYSSKSVKFCPTLNLISEETKHGQQSQRPHRKHGPGSVEEEGDHVQQASPTSTAAEESDEDSWSTVSNSEYQDSWSTVSYSESHSSVTTSESDSGSEDGKRIIRELDVSLSRSPSTNDGSGDSERSSRTSRHSSATYISVSASEGSRLAITFSVAQSSVASSESDSGDSEQSPRDDAYNGDSEQSPRDDAYSGDSEQSPRDDAYNGDSEQSPRDDAEDCSRNSCCTAELTTNRFDNRPASVSSGLPVSDNSLIPAAESASAPRDSGLMPNMELETRRYFSDERESYDRIVLIGDNSFCVMDADAPNDRVSSPEED